MTAGLPFDLALAKELHDLRAQRDGFRLAAAELLERADEVDRQLAEKSDLWDAIRDSEAELDRPARIRRGRAA